MTHPAHTTDVHGGRNRGPVVPWYSPAVAVATPDSKQREPVEQPSRDADAVDLTQIRASLARSLLDRLWENEDGVLLLEVLRNARRRA